MREYREELAVVKFLSALRPELASHVRGHILGGDTVPSLTTVFFLSITNRYRDSYSA